MKLKIAGLSSLCRTAQSAAVPVEEPPLSHSFLLSVELQDCHTKPPVSTPPPFLNPSLLVTGKDHLQSSREASLESEPWNWQCSICFRTDSPRKSYISTLKWYKIWGLVLIRQKGQNLLSTHFPRINVFFGTTLSFTPIWLVHSWLIRSLGTLSTSVVALYFIALQPWKDEMVFQKESGPVLSSRASGNNRYLYINIALYGH